MEAGRLEIVHGVRKIDPSGTVVRIEHAFGTEQARYLVNATNSVDRDVTSSRQETLVRNLVRRGALRPYRLLGQPSAGIDVDMQTFQCTGAGNLYAANMFLWGPGFFTSSAVLMATVIQRLLARAF